MKQILKKAEENKIKKFLNSNTDKNWDNKHIMDKIINAKGKHLIYYRDYGSDSTDIKIIII